MNKALTFVRLDCVTIKPYLTLKNLLILVGVSVIMSLNGNSVSTTIGLVMLFGSLYVSYPFAVGEKRGIDALYATLSITRGTVVLGRYLFSLLLNICAGILSCVMVSVLSLALKTTFDALETILIVLVVLAICSAIQAFQLPIYFKLGYSKAKFAAYLPFLIFPLAAFGLSSIPESSGAMNALLHIPLWINENPVIFSVICAALWLAIIMVSYRMSLAAYKKRDF